MTTIHPRPYKREPLTDAEIDQLRRDLPDEPIKLQQGWLACRTCGCAVETSNLPETSVIDVESRQPIKGPAALTMAASKGQRGVQLTFALCSLCRRAAEIAEQLTGEAAYRSPWALHQVNCALDAITFLTPSTLEQMAYLDSDGVQALARNLTALGASARWINRFVPVIEPGADPRTCSPHRFAHLKLGERQALRQAYAALLAERVARSAPLAKIPPPAVTDVHAGSGSLVLVRDGCLFCGIGYESVTAAEVAREGRDQIARDLWTPRRTPISSLGGQQSAGSVSGFLCRVCAEAQAHVGSIGPTALERALVAHLAPEGIGKLDYGQLRVDGLIGWSGLAARARLADRGLSPMPGPNSRPFGHLPNLAALTSQLKRRLG